MGLFQVSLYTEILGGYQSRYFNFFLAKFTYWLTLRRFRGVPVLILQLDFVLRTFRKSAVAVKKKTPCTYIVQYFM